MSMGDIATLSTIWLLHVAALVSPGANVLLVSQLAASGQSRGAAYTALGVALGAALWAASAVLGVHAVFALFPSLRRALQIAGGMYLLYVAWKLWRASSGGQSRFAPPLSAVQALRLGLLTNVTNPKSALFFGSIIAGAFPAQPTASLQIAAVLTLVTNALLWHLLLAWMFSRARIRAAYSRGRGVVGRLLAALLGAFGVGLLASTWRDARS